MAIQNRRGAYADFDPSKLKPGEYAIVQSGDPDTTDGVAVYICATAGTVKRLAFGAEINDYEATVQALAAAAQTSKEQAAEIYTAAFNAMTRAEAAEAALSGDLAARAAEIQAMTTHAEQTAGEALSRVNAQANTVGNHTILIGQLTTRVDSHDDEISNHADAIRTLQSQMLTKFDDAELTNEGLLNFLSNGEVVVGPLGPFAGGGSGGGGGSSGNNAVITASNTSGWTAKTIASGATCPFTFSWSSTEDDLPTGNGTLKLYVKGVLKATQNISQGSVSVELSSYLDSGDNNCTLQISDIYGNRRSLVITVSVISVTISSTFDSSVPYAGAITFPYTPVGSVAKTVKFFLDGTLIGTTETSVSGRQLTYQIPAQAYGSHSLRVYFECTISGETVRSNELYYEFISIGDGTGDPIISSSSQSASTLTQYASEAIEYTVYDPSSLTADVVIKINGTTFQTLTVDRTTQSVTIRYDTPGTTTITITCGNTTKTFTRTITESDADIAAVEDDLVLHLTAYGRSNNEEHPETWTDGTTSCTLSDFTYVSDGWLTDADSNDVLRVAGDARVTVPYKMFGSDFRSTGKTIEIEFATRDVMNYDSVIMTCMSGGKGIQITSREAVMSSEQTEVDTQFKEDEHIRLAFVTEKRAENRLVFIYINGIASRVVQYPSSDDFQQATPANFVIGSNDATVDIYCIRVYDNDLTSQQVMGNWIADTQDVDEMLDRYSRNNVFDAYGQIVIEKLPTDLPYCIITGDLPTYKGDKKTVSIDFYNPAAPGKNFSATGVQIDVQGTSSAGYPRKNFKPKFKKGFDLANGTHSATYQIAPGAIPTNCFCFKADVASSEGANNVELVRLYCDACPYETPAQEEDERIRQGIDGFPMVVFNTVGGVTTFVGKYNFNNDKSTEEVFGFADPDESWEVKNNTSGRVNFQSADFTGSEWLNDFEARYPDTDPAYEDATQLAEFVAWVASTDRSAATGSTLASPVTYDGVEFTSDTAAYRLAKFKAEAADYMELESAEFYYLFTELFLMVDSRAKNMFPSFIGEEVE